MSEATDEFCSSRGGCASEVSSGHGAARTVSLDGTGSRDSDAMDQSYSGDVEGVMEDVCFRAEPLLRFAMSKAWRGCFQVSAHDSAFDIPTKCTSRTDVNSDICSVVSAIRCPASSARQSGGRALLRKHPRDDGLHHHHHHQSLQQQQ